MPNGSLIDLDRPTPVPWLNEAGPWKRLVTGPNFGAALGERWLFVWGYDDVVKKFLPPKQVPLEGVVEVGCSTGEIFCLTNRGDVFAVNWQTGEVTLVSKRIGPKWVQMSVGDAHVGLLDDTGGVWSFGSNGVGQCAQPVSREGRRNSFNLGGTERTLEYPNSNISTPAKIPLSTPCQQLVCGGSHTLLLTADDSSVLAVGDDSHIQLGLGDTRSVDSRDYVPHSGMERALESTDSSKLFAATSPSVKYSWYEKHFRSKPTLMKIPESSSEEKISQVIAGSDFSVLRISPSDKLIACGENQLGQCGRGLNKQQQTFAPVKLPKNIPIQKIACGAAHCVAALADGSVHVWGGNAHGQLGTGSRASACPPAVIHRSKIRGPLLEDIISTIREVSEEDRIAFLAEADRDKPPSGLQFATEPVAEPTSLKTRILEALDKSRESLRMTPEEQVHWEPVNVEASYNNTFLTMRRTPERKISPNS